MKKIFIFIHEIDLYLPFLNPFLVKQIFFQELREYLPWQNVFWAIEQISINLKELKLYSVFSDHSGIQLEINKR